MRRVATDRVSLTPEVQYVWSPRYVAAAVLRDRNTDSDGLSDDERIYYLNDANFNVTTLVDASGDAVERYLYEAYGRVTVYDGAWANVRGESSYANAVLYTGRERDAETGLYHYRHRSLAAELGRFASRDPIAYADGVNLQPYVQDKPIATADPLGFYRVDTQMDAFIPQEWLMVDPQSWVKGDNRNIGQTPLGLGASRMLQTATVEMEECVKRDPEIAQFGDINFSVMITYNYIGGEKRVIRKKGTLAGTVTVARTGPCDLQIKKQAHGHLPWSFVPFAPAIDWEVLYDLHFRELLSGGVRVWGTLTGKRDGFPGYESYVMSTLVHSHDPRITGDSAFSLFPPMEYSINSGFSLIDPNGKAQCCKCKE